MFAYYLQARQRATRAACHEKYMIPNSFCARKPRIIRFAEKSHNIPRIVAASPARHDSMRGIPPLTSLRSFAPPYAEAKGAYACTPCHSERSTLSFRAKRGIFPPSQSVRGARGDALAAVPQAASVKSPAICDNYQGIPRSHRSARSRPLTLREGGVPSHPLSLRAKHSVIPSNPMSFRAKRGISPPPFAKRKGGSGGMPCQPLHKRRTSTASHLRQLPGHPPLTSLRSFAPPYALRRGRTLAHAHHHLHTPSLHHLPPAHDIR